MSQNKVGRSANAERPIEIELLFGLVDRIRITSDHQFLIGQIGRASCRERVYVLV